jgi:hypothetical protein
MAVISLEGFYGENRAAHPKKLGPSVGVTSLNQKPGRGDLRPWRLPLTVATVPGGRKTIYRGGRDVDSDSNYWLSWANRVHAVRGFNQDDTTEQTYYTGDGVPKVTNNIMALASAPYPTTSRPLGMPKPTSAPTVSVVAEATSPNAGKQSMYIASTWIDSVHVGDKFRIRFESGTSSIVTLTAGTGGVVTKASATAQFDAVAGIAASVMPDDDKYNPGTVRLISDAVGTKFYLEVYASDTTSYATGDVTYTTMFSSTGHTGSDSELVSAIAPTSPSSFTNFTLSVIKTEADGLATNDKVAVMINGVIKGTVSVSAPGKAALATALNSILGVIATVGYSDEGVECVNVNVGTVDRNAVVRIVKDPSTGASGEITQAYLDANIPPSTRWQITVSGYSPVSVTFAAGSGTYPSAVTIDTAKSALGSVPGLTVTEVGSGSARKLVISTSEVGSSVTLLAKKIIPGVTSNWTSVKTSSAETDSTGSVYTYFYVYTYVNDWGWESAPSPTSAQVDRTAKATVNISGFSAPPDGNYNINKIRLYRTQTGASGATEFFFLREIAYGVTTTTDDNRSLGEVMATSSWTAAPDDLSMLTPMWNGMLGAISGNGVRICEPYTPYAWPIAYEILPPDSKPVALGVFGQTLLVLTTARPLIVAGSSPNSMDQQPLEMYQGCIAPESVVGMGMGVAWASEDGLCWYGAGGARIVTAGIMLREDWQRLKPASIVGKMYEGLYFGTYNDGSGLKAFLIDPINPAGIFFLDTGYSAMHFDELKDQLYVLDSTGNVQRWDAGTAFMTAKFRSKVHQQPRVMGFAAAEVVCDSYPATLRVDVVNLSEGDAAKILVSLSGVPGVTCPTTTSVRYTCVVTSRNAVRLPTMSGLDWQIEVETTNNIQLVNIATSMLELATV